MSDVILVHLGDLHFGHDVDLAQVAAIEKFVSELRPDAVCLTGDVTTRARHGELQVRSILDVGCGTGALAAAAVRRWPGVRVTGVDASGGMLAVAARELGALPHAGVFRRGDAEAVAAWVLARKVSPAFIPPEALAVGPGASGGDI